MGKHIDMRAFIAAVARRLDIGGCRTGRQQPGRAGWLGSLLAECSGTSAVEFGLAAPVLLVLLVPVADLGIAFSQRYQLQQAVQAGAQYASFHPWNSNSPGDIANAVSAASALAGVSVTPAPSEVCGCPNGTAVNMATCNSTCSNGETAGYYVVVNAQVPYAPPLPYSALGASTVLTAQATVRIR